MGIHDSSHLYSISLPNPAFFHLHTSPFHASTFSPIITAIHAPDQATQSSLILSHPIFIPSSYLSLAQPIYFCPEKNQLVLLFPAGFSFCSPLIAGITGPSLPPPLSGFAILEPPNEKPPAPEEESRPRVDPTLAASRRSFTAVSWASNLWCCQLVLKTKYG